METLNLNLKKKWFDMTLSGVKKEEYREIKPFWVRRLTNQPFSFMSTTEGEILRDINACPNGVFKKFDVTRFMNGMAKDAPVFTIEHKGIRIGEGNPEWGAEPGKQYFIIMHGEVLETKNINQ